MGFRSGLSATILDSTDADSKDEYGQMPLSLATKNWHKAVVKLLLTKRGVDPDSKIMALGHRYLGLKRVGMRRW
jgi:ankyrin repeat protein